MIGIQVIVFASDVVQTACAPAEVIHGGPVVCVVIAVAIVVTAVIVATMPGGVAVKVIVVVFQPVLQTYTAHFVVELTENIVVFE